jgi:CO/xanthine dehydrogenase Mo-binding subunit
MNDRSQPALSPLDRPNSYIGRAVPRPNLDRLLAGRGQFVSDVVLPRMVHVAFVRSPHAHARIRAIDTAAAKRAAGVVAVVTGAELAKVCSPWVGVLTHLKGLKSAPQHPIALDKACWQGEAVAAVVAKTRALAEDAAELVAVDYEPLPPVADAETALDPQTPVIHPELGDNLAFERSLDAARIDRVRADAGEIVDLEAGDVPVVHDGDAAFDAVIAGMNVGHEALDAVGDELDRAFEQLRERRGRHLVGVDVHLDAEGAADVLGQHPHLMLLEPEMLGEDVLHHVRGLRALMDGEPRFGRIPVGDDRARLERDGVGGARISSQDGAVVRLDATGAVICHTGVTEQGQGAEAVIAQVVATAFGVPIERVRVITGDTDNTPYGGGTWASRAAGIGGEAAWQAGKALRANVLAVAASILQPSRECSTSATASWSTPTADASASSFRKWRASPISGPIRCRRISRPS